jgi:heat shock protein HtpX
MVEELAQRANIPKPKIYLVPMEQPNAFATGRGPSRSAVAVTAGILQLLDRDELRGVLAHEIAHIKNRDVLVATIAATIAGAISYLVNMLQWALLFGHSRNEEEGNNNPLSLIGSIATYPCGKAFDPCNCEPFADSLRSNSYSVTFHTSAHYRTNFWSSSHRRFTR